MRNDCSSPCASIDLLDGPGSEASDQLVLEVCHAHVEAEGLHVGPSDVDAETGALETALEVVFLRGVTQAREPHVEPLRAELLEEAADRLRTTDRHDGHALGVEIAASTLGEGFERALVADPFDEHDGAWRGAIGRAWAVVAGRWSHRTSLPVRIARSAGRADKIRS